MTPEAQRIAIAELLGWTQRTEGLFWNEDKQRAAILKGSALEATRRKMGLPCDNGVLLPDPLTDLNAIHDAEKVLTGTQNEDYWDEVAKLVPDTKGMFGILHATAAHRAEAFLRTVGRWTD